MTNIILTSDADIIPDVGMGGVLLRAPIQDLFMLIVRRTTLLFSRREPWSYMSNLFEATYDFEFLTISVDIRIGLIVKITGNEKYGGCLFGSISTGMRVGEVLAVDPRIHYSEILNGLSVEGTPGVLLETDVFDPDPEELPNLIVTKISVIAGEYYHMNTKSGMRLESYRVLR